MFKISRNPKWCLLCDKFTIPAIFSGNLLNNNLRILNSVCIIVTAKNQGSRQLVIVGFLHVKWVLYLQRMTCFLQTIYVLTSLFLSQYNSVQSQLLLDLHSQIRPKKHCYLIHLLQQQLFHIQGILSSASAFFRFPRATLLQQPQSLTICSPLLGT